MRNSTPATINCTISLALADAMRRFGLGDMEASELITRLAKREGWRVQFVLSGTARTRWGSQPVRRQVSSANLISVAMAQVLRATSHEYPHTLQVNVGAFHTRFDSAGCGHPELSPGGHKVAMDAKATQALFAAERSTQRELTRKAYAESQAREAAARERTRLRIIENNRARYASRNHYELTYPHGVRFYWEHDIESAKQSARNAADLYGRDSVSLRAVRAECAA